MAMKKLGEQMKKVYIIIWCLLFCLSALIASKVWGQEMRYREGVAIKMSNFNPLNPQNAAQLRLATLIFNSLAGINIDTLKPEAELLKELKSNIHDYNSEKEYDTFLLSLRQDVKWYCYDAQSREIVAVKDFTAHDVEYTFRQIQNSKEPIYYKYITDVIKDIKSLSNDEIEITLLYKMTLTKLAENYLTFKIIPQLPSESPYSKGIVGAGPYIFAAQKGDDLQLLRNEHYFKPLRNLNSQIEIAIDRIIMTRIQLEKTAVEELLSKAIPTLHLMPTLSTGFLNRVKASENAEYQQHNVNHFSYFGYNCERFNENARKAFTYALDLQQIFVTVYGKIFPELADEPIEKIKYIISGPYSADERDPDIPPPSKNITEAKRLLEASRFDRKEITLKSYLASAGDMQSAEDATRICQEFKNQIERNLGITVKIVSLDSHSFDDEVLERKDFDVVYGEWVFKQGANTVKNLFGSEAKGSSISYSRNNFISYHNPQLYELLQKYDIKPIHENRVDIKHQMHAMIAEDCPYTFLFSIPEWAAYRSDALDYVKISPYYFFSFITYWNMKPRF
jgi:ABC-type transport system substrate-binding protein